MAEQSKWLGSLRACYAGWKLKIRKYVGRNGYHKYNSLWMPLFHDLLASVPMTFSLASHWALLVTARLSWHLYNCVKGLQRMSKNMHSWPELAFYRFRRRRSRQSHIIENSWRENIEHNRYKMAAGPESRSSIWGVNLWWSEGKDWNSLEYIVAELSLWNKIWEILYNWKIYQMGE